MFIVIFVILVIAITILLISKSNNQTTSQTIQDQEEQDLEFYRICNPLTAESRLKIVKDCIDLVNTTKNPDVFFPRYEKLMEELEALAKMEGHIKFSGQLPSEALQDFLSRKQYTVNDFINRYCDSVSDKIYNLTTLKSKMNNAQKFYDSLVKYQEYMSVESLSLIEEKYEELQDLFDEKEEEIVPLPSTPVPIENNDPISLNDWNIIVSFNKSTSANFDKALYWAKKSNDYQENEYNGQIVYQAKYSAHPQSFMDFMQLYDFVKDWKSSAFIINSEFIDKKIVGKIKWCYGDKCITAKSDFCYGASYMTKNPFGCHRLQISSCNNPWWSFSSQQGDKIKIDKNAIRQRIDEYSTAYRLCPAFNYSHIIDTLSRIPDYITNEEQQKLQFHAYSDKADAFLGIN